MDTEETIQVYQLPRRPRGEYSNRSFKEVDITTNFYPVTIKTLDQIYIYKYIITPKIPLDDRTTRTSILTLATPEITRHIPNPVFSGFNILSTEKGTNEFSVEAGDHKVNVKEVKILDIKSNKMLLLHFLNNGLRNLMSRLKYMEIGKSGTFFNSQKSEKIENLSMFSGYRANFMLLETGFYLRVDTAKKIVRSQTVLQYIDEIYRNNQYGTKEEKRELVKQSLVGKIIMTNYGKPRYVKVADIEFIDIDGTFIEGTETSIRQYYTTKYNINIENSKQPLLVVEERKKKEQKTYMVPEICLMTGIPDDFDEYRRKKISQATIKSAEERKREIGGLMNEIKNTSELNSLNEIGIKIDSEMSRFKAKIIPPPKIKLGQNEKIESGKESFFNLFAQPIFASKHSLRVGVLYFRSSDVSELISVFDQTSKKLQSEIRCIKMSLGEFDNRRALSAIEDGLNKANEKEECNICLIVIPNQLKTQYKKIKELSLLKNNMVCQITTEATLRKNNFRSIATKILLQIIAKRGNTLWVPESAMTIDKVMLAAFDNAKSGSKNILSGVATINSTFSSICSRVEEYSDSSNKMNSMVTVLLRLIESYNKRNKFLPKSVVLFMNSVSNDQVSLLQEFMIQPAISKMSEIYKEDKPNLTIVMVNTKTNERFFSGDGSMVRNVPAGTIISENIVSNNYDFFMVSQFSTRGSSVPNHYKVIYNDSKMEEGILQELIYSQCFNYVNWTGSIKVPGILQYAKKCVKFSSEVLEARKIAEELESKLYFI